MEAPIRDTDVAVGTTGEHRVGAGPEAIAILSADTRAIPPPATISLACSIGAPAGSAALPGPCRTFRPGAGEDGLAPAIGRRRCVEWGVSRDSTHRQPRTPTEVRRRGLKLIGIGLVFGSVWFALMELVMVERHRAVMGPGLGLPLLPLLVGLVELVSGRHFDELSRGWDELRGWQRGLLGLVIVALATVVIVTLAGFVVVLLVRR